MANSSQVQINSCTSQQSENDNASYYQHYDDDYYDRHHFYGEGHWLVQA